MGKSEKIESCESGFKYAVENRAKREEISKAEAIRRFSSEMGIPLKTIEGWVYPVNRTLKTQGTDKPIKKHTKPDKKIQLTDMVTEIEKDNISDEDLKQVVDVIADKVKSDSVSPRVIARASTTFNKKFKHGKRKEKFIKKKSESEKMSNQFLNAVDSLDTLVGRGPDHLSIKDRKILTGEFRMLIPRLIIILLNMGFDILAITNEIIKRRIERGTHEKIDNKISVIK